VLTPLLALLLAREGLPVLLHGMRTEARRTRASSEVLAALGVYLRKQLFKNSKWQVAFVPTALLQPRAAAPAGGAPRGEPAQPGTQPGQAHEPVRGPRLVVSSYTHPEYAISMAATFALTHANALLLRGTEGEAVADPRRTPTMQAFVNGQTFTLQEHQAGPLTSLPNLPTQLDAATTAAYIQSVMTGASPCPPPFRSRWPTSCS
jgi:anthranilate phosphoribosyltransferase